MERPAIIVYLISIGFEELIGQSRPVWGQGDGDYWHGKLKRGNDIVYTDRDTTHYGYTLNGVKISEKCLLELI